MNKLEQMHLDAIDFHTIVYPDVPNEVDAVKAAFKSSEITEQIAIEFVRWYENRDKSIDENMLIWEDYYKEFLKTKQ